MAIQTVTDAIRYVGVDDNTLALFENQYPVQPMGVSYNSHVILDEKIAVMDSVDARAAEEWLSNVAQVLEGRNPDYLVVTHMEPDHSGSLMRLAQKYPEMKIVGNAKPFTLIKQFFGTGAFRKIVCWRLAKEIRFPWACTGCAFCWHRWYTGRR